MLAGVREVRLFVAISLLPATQRTKRHARVVAAATKDVKISCRITENDEDFAEMLLRT